MKLLRHKLGFVFGALLLAITGNSVREQSDNGTAPHDALKRDQVVSEMMIQMGSTLRCLLKILDADINIKLNRLWDGNWERVKKEAIFKLTDDQIMDLVYEKVKITLKAIQSIHPHCARIPSYPCDHLNHGTNKLKASKVMEDLRDYFEDIGVTMKCLLAHNKLDTRIHSVYAKSFVRYHDYQSQSKASQVVTQQELGLMLAHLKKLETNCQMVSIGDDKPCNSSVL